MTAKKMSVTLLLIVGCKYLWVLVMSYGAILCRILSFQISESASPVLVSQENHQLRLRNDAKIVFTAFFYDGEML